MNLTSINKKIVLLICLALFIVIGGNAQEKEGSISAINDFSIKAIKYNPNGIRIYAFDNTLMLNFKEKAINLKYEIINNKGKILLRKKETKGVHESILNITSLEKGTYWVRVSCNHIEDFLKFIKK